MTDAERIAQYLKTTVGDIESCLIEPPHRASSVHVRELAAMLADVRREEREGCKDIVAEQKDAAALVDSKHANIFFDRAIKRIAARGAL
jgi:hypothetical protein